MHEFCVWTFGCCLPILSSYHIIFFGGQFLKSQLLYSNIPAKIAIFFVTFLGRKIKLYTSIERSTGHWKNIAWHKKNTFDLNMFGATLSNSLVYHQSTDQLRLCQNRPCLFFLRTRPVNPQFSNHPNASGNDLEFTPSIAFYGRPCWKK